MVKKITFLISLVICLPVWTAFAKEESLQPLAPIVGMTRRIAPTSATVAPYQFSVSPGKWTQAKAGQVFSDGFHPASFALPSLKESPAPIRYPRWAVREGWEGRFVIAIEVLVSGEVGRWKIMESTGYPLLDEVAVKAVKAWKFHPASENGKLVVACIQIPIHFELKD